MSKEKIKPIFRVIPDPDSYCTLFVEEEPRESTALDQAYADEINRALTLSRAHDDMLAVMKKVREFIKEEADNRGDAGSEYSDYEREPRELVKEIDAVIRAAKGRANG